MEKPSSLIPIERIQRLWKKLARRRRARRKLLRRFLARKILKTLGLFEFAHARPPQDCIGQWIER